MVMIAPCREIVAVMQITDHTADTLTIDIAQQGDDFRLRIRNHNVQLLVQSYDIFPFAANKYANNSSYFWPIQELSYEEYTEKAWSPSDQAYTYEKRADDCRYYYSILDDDTHLREAEECEDNAQINRDYEEDFRRKADEAFDKWQRLEDEIRSVE